MSKVDKSRSELLDRKFRPLKKMMKKNCKIFDEALANKQLPPALVMDDFLAQVKVMVSYTGFGDDDYATFMTACEALYGAFKRKDLTLFAECFAVVLSLKKECHHRYK